VSITAAAPGRKITDWLKEKEAGFNQLIIEGNDDYTCSSGKKYKYCCCKNISAYSSNLFFLDD
jgi:hypothetical protein